MEKVLVELPKSLLDGLESYARFCDQTLQDTVRQILGDFMFGIIEDGFNSSATPGGTRSARR